MRRIRLENKNRNVATSRLGWTPQFREFFEGIRYIVNMRTDSLIAGTKSGVSRHSTPWIAQLGETNSTLLTKQLHSPSILQTTQTGTWTLSRQFPETPVPSEATTFVTTIITKGRVLAQSVVYGNPTSKFQVQSDD
jgi:hypothetical protein